MTSTANVEKTETETEEPEVKSRQVKRREKIIQAKLLRARAKANSRNPSLYHSWRLFYDSL